MFSKLRRQKQLPIQRFASTTRNERGLANLHRRHLHFFGSEEDV